MLIFEIPAVAKQQVIDALPMWSELLRATSLLTEQSDHIKVLSTTPPCPACRMTNCQDSDACRAHASLMAGRHIGVPRLFAVRR